MAEGNVIQKIIRLILDRNSADEVEKGTKETTGKVDAAWKATAAKIAGYLGVAFLTKKVLDFGKAAVEEARNSQAAWSDLAGTIEANGESFDKLEGKLRATGDAFQEAFGIDDDKFAASLSRVITLTGDVGASTQNMGLVANVAAKFFNGELEPAANLVAKAMNGNVAALQKMGIHADNAQQALEILASRSMGAAEKRAGTFAGKLDALNNLWDDFLKDVGNAIIGSDGAASAFDVLKAAIATLADWVGRNREAISQWVTRGVNLAIDAADVLYRAIVGMSKILAGGFQAGLGVAAKGLAMLTRGYVGALNAASAFLELIGQKEQSDALDLHAAAMLNDAKALDTWADAAIKAGSDKVFAGLDRLGTTAFSSSQFKPGAAPKASATVPVLPPVVGKNAELSDTDKAFKKFDDTLRQAKETITGTGAEIQFLQVQAKALETIMDDLTKAGVKPADEWMKFFGASLHDVNAQIEEAKKIETLRKDWEDYGRANEAASLTTDSHATKLQRMQAEANLLKSTIQNLIADGLDPQDEALQKLVIRLGEVQDAIDSETAAMQFQQQVAGDLAQALFASFSGGLGPFARMKAKQNYLEATEDALRAGLAALTGFGALHAGKYAAAAVQHAALGAAWSALASVSGGGSGGGGTSVGSSGSGSPSSAVGSSRNSSASQAQKFKAPEPITEIHFVGPGFDAVNPQVQRVVIGAQQQAIERVGANANIRVIRRNT